MLNVKGEDLMDKNVVDKYIDTGKSNPIKGYIIVPFYAKNLMKEWDQGSWQESGTEKDIFDRHIRDLFNAKKIQQFSKPRHTGGFGPVNADKKKKIFLNFDQTRMVYFDTGYGFVVFWKNLSDEFYKDEKTSLDAIKNAASILEQDTKILNSFIKDTGLLPKSAILFPDDRKCFTFLDWNMPSTEVSFETLLDVQTLKINGRRKSGHFVFSEEQNDRKRQIGVSQNTCVIRDEEAATSSGEDKGVHDKNSENYLMIYLLALHERIALLNFISRSIYLNEDDTSKENTESFEDLRNELNKFQSFFIYDVVSDDARYQIFYEKLEDFFGTKKLESDVSNVIKESDRRERETIAKEEEKRGQRLTAFITLLTVLTIFSVIDDILDLADSISNPGNDVSVALRVILLLIALVTGVIFWKKEYPKNSKK